MSFNITTLSPEVQDMYLNATLEYKDIIEGIFNPSDGIEVDKKERPTPPYARGTLDKPLFSGGMPLGEKPRKLVNAILSGNYRLIEIEGGVRGSKDIYALFAWAKYLMSCPDKVHLALGSSLEHVLRTVLMSNGFGLYFLIPHGVFVRETINGAQRGVYKFLDNYGLEKQILFYGNEKENDKNKFQGFTIGSVYINESLNHHVDGIIEADNRMGSSRQPLMITTQNPRGKAHPFYMRFEKSKLATIRDIERMEFIRDEYKHIFDEFEKAIIKDRDNEKRKVINDILKQHAVIKISELPVKWQLLLNEMLLNLNYEFDKIIRNKSVEDFVPDFIEGENDYLKNKSMKKVISFDRGDTNGNNVKNAYDFYYAHFTVEDNLSMSEMQRHDFANSKVKGSSDYDQSILGLRRSTDSAVFSMFMTNDYTETPRGNLMSGDVDSDLFKETYMRGAKTYRVMSVDKGLNHPNGIIDVDVDFNNGTIYQLGESLLDVKAPDVLNLGLETIYQEVLTVIRARRGREMPVAIIIDPSAIELYIYLREKGLPVVKGNNAVFRIRGEENVEAHYTQDRDVIGLPLMQTAIAKFKYLVHDSCIYTIEQIGSYEAPFDDKTGKEKVKKVNDDLVDALRYIFNHYVRMSMWEGVIKDDEISIPEDERTQTETKPKISATDFLREITGQLEDFGGTKDIFADPIFFGGDDPDFW